MDAASEREFDVCSIIPPHILDEIEKNGSPEQKAWAKTTLEHTAAYHHTRATVATWTTHLAAVRAEALAAEGAEAAVGAGVAAAAAAAAKIPKRRIYDCKHLTRLPGTLVRQEGNPPGHDAEVNEAYDGLGATLQLYKDVFKRNSIDNAGLDLTASVHYGINYNNAMWNGFQMVFGDGDGTIFNRFTIAIDVIGHELAHGVTQYSGEMDYVGESGALNESMSDVFGSLVKQYHLKQTASAADWLIGAGLLNQHIKGVALRSMKAPGTAYNDPLLGKDPQPATMSKYVHTSGDNGGVHINSGIPNHAFYLTAIAFGGHSWEKAGQIWYAALTDHTRPHNVTFADFAQRTVTQAKRLYGPDAAKTVAKAWKDVEINTTP